VSGGWICDDPVEAGVLSTLEGAVRLLFGGELWFGGQGAVSSDWRENQNGRMVVLAIDDT